MKNKALVLERETFVTKKGKEMYNYFVRGVAHGREIKADFWQRTWAAMSCSTLCLKSIRT